jgi:putative mRNA 3-end processing factor
LLVSALEMNSNLIQFTDRGPYCPAGGFYIDPWASVERAIITHAHSDHAHPGCGRYLTAHTGQHVLRLRLGEAVIDTLEYGERLTLDGVTVSLHPAGHILGSAQVRVEHRGQVWLVSGDYKLDADMTCIPLELVGCHTFVTESTFGLPIYRWPPQQVVFDDINAWWRANQQAGRASVLFGYSLGKAQRVLAGLDPSIGPIYTHGAIEQYNAAYRASGVRLPATQHVGAAAGRAVWQGAMILAPPSARRSPWMRRFGRAATGFASGWMQIRGARKQRAVDRGFILSDHADWPGLQHVIAATGAQRVLVTHGYSGVLARWLREKDLDTAVVGTRYEGERDDAIENVVPEVADEAQAVKETPQ